MPTVEILYFAGCPSYRSARASALRAMASSGVEAPLTMTLVRSARDAKALDFHGSPTIRIDGVDIDPQGLGQAGEVGLVSRPYRFEGRAFGAPPEAMIARALTWAASARAPP